MSRAPLIRAIAAFAVIAASLYVALTMRPTLGLDLRGGTQIVLETRDSPTVKADAETTDRTLEVLRRRVDALGVSEPTLARSGEQRIIVELPGVLDPSKAAEVIGKTAQLTIHPVIAVADANTKPGKGEQVIADEDGSRILVGPARLSGDDVGAAEAGIDPQSGGGWFVTIDFRGKGTREWPKLTGEAACNPSGDPKRRVAIVLDGKVLVSPQVNEDVACNVGLPGNSTQITGSFTAEEAKELAVLIEGGSLPVPVVTVEQRTVGPTLGAAAIAASAQAAVIGVALTALFIVITYRLVGLVAAFALATYGLISYAALVALGATLTLPGLAGFVLAIGMAVDANVLVFERAREEYAARSRPGTGSAAAKQAGERREAAAAGGGTRLRQALEKGFRNAWSAVADSNITTLLAAGLLFFLASGPVRGFGVTLSIGVLASMVTAMVITRVIAQWAVNRRAVASRPAITGIAGIGRLRTWLNEHGPDLMRHHVAYLVVAAVVAVAALTGLAVRGLNYGVEFTGGRIVEYSTTQAITADTARELVADAGFPSAVVQTSGKDISVRTGQIGNAEVNRIEASLERGAGQVNKVRDELIGPSMGAELRRNALIALAVALAAQLAYLAFRFRWTFGLAAVLTLAVDASVVVGAFAWLNKPIDGVFLAAMLTVIGYSVNDKVVVFDRVRELWGERRKEPFAAVANTAILQTVPRTVNTGLGAIFILAALAVLGGSSLTDFAVALLIGVIVGTLSSAFVAAPLAIRFEKRNPAPPPQPKLKRTARPREGSGAVV
ncbi:protein translocase subunit SecDF [Planomonospora parontospora subsp. parontospora]|uniref:Multifunctional fusion protein n=2 Tax=Planomonospora parontospora TaxID=58119 RepID=A0AA37BHB5_9ACTN|nr:protein translocase subunit SecD [Planomonospora parontospora]GGK70597.1 protein translocase subunit SecDF [Planomonospora parontospora]GII09792.1 protein translocase subunit SecDF [Planomonospora parontospora subsp. parontospora]